MIKFWASVGFKPLTSSSTVYYSYQLGCRDQRSVFKRTDLLLG